MPRLEYQLLPLCRQSLTRLLDRIEAGETPFIMPSPLSTPPEFSRKRHFHALPELVLQVSGQSILDCPGERIRINVGDFFITPSCLPHVEYPVATADPFLNLVFVFGDDDVSVHSTESPRPPEYIITQTAHLYTHQVDTIVAHCEQIVEYHQLAAGRYRQIIHALGMALAHELLSTLEQQPHRAVLVPPKIDACKHYALSNLSNPTLSVRMLAERLHWSPDYLSSAFHQATGMPLHQFIAQQRLALAKRLLSNSALSIAAIAAACGYSDPAYFTRAFKNGQGCPPSAYRRQSR